MKVKSKRNRKGGVSDDELSFASTRLSISPFHDDFFNSDFDIQNFRDSFNFSPRSFTSPNISPQRLVTPNSTHNLSISPISPLYESPPLTSPPSLSRSPSPSPTRRTRRRLLFDSPRIIPGSPSSNSESSSRGGRKKNILLFVDFILNINPYFPLPNLLSLQLDTYYNHL